MNIGKRIMSLLLSLVLIIGIMPATKVLAESSKTLNKPIRFSSEKVWYGSDVVSGPAIAPGATFTRATSGGAITYTLTLDNVNISSNLESPYQGFRGVIETLEYKDYVNKDERVDLVIVLKGENTITSEKSGIDVVNGTLTLKKEASGDSATLSVSSKNSSIRGARGVDISDLTVNVNSSGYGISSGSYTGDTSLSDCNINIKDSKINISKANIGIDAGNQTNTGNISIINSDVTMTGGSGSSSQIIRANDGTITFTGDSTNKSTLDVSADAGISTLKGKNISISYAKGKIIANGEYYSALSSGGSNTSIGDVSITNSNLVISGGRSGVWARNLSVTGIKGEDQVDIRTTRASDIYDMAIELSGKVTSDSKIQASDTISGALADATTTTLSGKRRVVFFKEQPTVIFTASTAAPIFIAKTAKSDVEIGTVSTSVFGSSVSCAVQFYKAGQSGEYGNSHISGTVSDGKVKVTTLASIPAGTYYFNIKAKEDDVEKTTPNYSVTVLDSTISSVSLSIPSSLTVGNTFDAVGNLFKVSEGVVGYSIDGSVDIYPHNLNKEPIEDENEPKTIQNNRVYRVVFQIKPVDGLQISKGEEATDSNWYSDKEKVYKYTGAITGTPYDVVVLSNGKLLVGYEYTVKSGSSNNGYYYPTYTTPSNTNTNTNTNTGDTIPVEGNEGTSVSVKVESGNAKIGDITDAVINAADGKSDADTNLAIDLSSKSNVTSATLTNESLNKITKAVNDVDNSVKGLEINFAGGTAEFDSVAVNSINNQAAGDVTISITQVTTTTLNNAQKEAVSELSVVTVVKATVTSNGKTISNFNGGVQTISVSVNLSGRNGNYFHAFYVASNGTMTAQKTYFANGKVKFLTNHNSEFVIVYDETTENNPLINVYRAYNPNNGDHFLTVNKAEYDKVISLGWRDEKVAFKVLATNGTSVYRMYNPNTGEHFYTQNEKEKSNLMKYGWRLEGSMFVSTGDKNVYRVYNANQAGNNHHFTTSEVEYKKLISQGWRDEGVAFKAN